MEWNLFMPKSFLLSSSVRDATVRNGTRQVGDGPPWPKLKKWKSISEDDLGDLHGKVVIVTGSNQGIGYSTVQFLVRKGAKVYMASRNESKAKEAMKQLEQEGILDGKLEWLELDLLDLRQVKETANAFVRKEERLDILINNAAMVPGAFKLTEYGILDVMQVNHIAHFLLTTLLLPLMKKTATEPHSDVRIINLTSASYEFSVPSTFIGKETLNMDYGPGFKAVLKTYVRSKLANILFTKHLQERLISENVDIICIAVFPGGVTTPGTRQFFRIVPFFNKITTWLGPLLFTEQKKGAWTSVYAAACEEVRNVENEAAKEGREVFKGAYMTPVAKITKLKKHAEDETLAKELWETTEGVLKELALL